MVEYCLVLFCLLLMVVYFLYWFGYCFCFGVHFCVVIYANFWVWRGLA